MFKAITSEPNEIITYDDFFYNPEKEMDVYNIYAQNKNSLDSIYTRSLLLVSSKLGITSSSILTPAQIQQNLTVTASLNQKYPEYSKNYNTIDVTRLDILGQTYKPSAIEYYKCSCNSLYGNLANPNLPYTSSKTFYYHTFPLTQVTPYSNSILQAGNPQVQFKIQNYTFQTDKVKISTNWKITYLPPNAITNSYIGTFYIRTSDFRFNYILMAYRPNYSSFEAIISKSTVSKYLSKQNQIDLILGFTFNTQSYYKIAFNNVRVESI